MKFHSILPGIAVGRPEHGEHHIVQGIACLIPDGAVCAGIAGHCGHGLSVGGGEHTLRNRKCIRTGNPDHGDAPHSIRGGNSGDG